MINKALILFKVFLGCGRCPPHDIIIEIVIYYLEVFVMKNKKIGIGSLSLLLVIIAFVWAFNIFGVCVGDHILATLNIPTWSNMANATGTHYTIFYSFIFLIPALILSIKYKDNLFAKVGKWLSITFIGILSLGFIFMVV